MKQQKVRPAAIGTGAWSGAIGHAALKSKKADTSLQIYKKGKAGAENIPLTVGNPILEEIDEFADCIRTGSRPETDGESALAALALIRAAIESARTGEKARVQS